MSAKLVLVLVLALAPFAALAQAPPPAAVAPQAPAPTSSTLQPAVAADAVVGQRGPAMLTVGQLRQALATLDPDQRRKLSEDRQALAGFVRDRMLYAAILDEARAKGFDQRPDVAARAEQARMTVIVESYLNSLTLPDAAYPTEADIQAAYDAAKGKIFTPRQLHLAQIIVAAPPGADKTADDNAHALIVDLRAQAAKPKADFAAIARKSSDDHRTAPAGGDLGWLREDQLVPQIRAALTGLADGALSDPVRLDDGWHLIHVVATKAPAPASLAEARDTLAQLLRQARQQQAARTYLDSLRKAAPVQVNEIALATSLPHETRAGGLPARRPRRYA